MGEVYLAEDTKLDRKVALKVLINDFSEDKDRINRFIREAKAASALNHPNILTVYEIGNSDGSQYISTELIKGETLRDRMKQEPIELRGALSIVAQITAALGAAHEAGIIHRDIKPENVMIRNDGVVKVLDFGLAKLSPLATGSVETTLPQINTKPGMIVGTIAYMSPEQARGRAIDPRSDIFSLGIVMFEMFTGKRPFDGESQLELVSSILKDDPPPLRQVVQDMPRELERIVDKALRKDRDNRYQHIKDLLIDIEDLDEELKFESKLNRSTQPTVAGGIQITNPSNLGSAFSTSISKTRRFTVLHVLALVLVMGLGFFAFWYFRSASRSAAPPTFKTTEVASWTAAPGELFGTARFSPDGRLIAFASTRSGTNGIWVTQTNSTDAIPVTNDKFFNIDPIWSARGDEIAYVSVRPGSDGSMQRAVWRISALGGGTPKIVAPISDASARLRQWTQNGKIFFEIRGVLQAIDVANGSMQKIADLGDKKAKWLSISPDEKDILFMSGGDNDWQLMKSDLSGSQITEIARSEGQSSRDVSWCHEKDTVIFSATIKSQSKIISVNIKTGEVAHLASPEMDATVVDVTADGGSLLIGGSKEESTLWRISISDSKESPVARDLEAKLWPGVSPDSQSAVFQSVKGLNSGNSLLGGSIQIKSLRPGTEADRATQLAGEGFLPAFSPNGGQVAYLKMVGGMAELFTAGINGGAERKLAGTAVEAFSVSPYNLAQTSTYSWSPDGSSIAYVVGKDGIYNVWRVSTSDGTTTQITASTEKGLIFSSPIWSPDGKRIAFGFRWPRDASGRVVRGLRVADAETGATTGVHESARITRLIGWTADNASLIVAEADKENDPLPPQTKIVRFVVGGGAETLIVSLQNNYFYNIFLSADRKQIAYAARDQNLDDLWVIPVTGGVPRKLTRNNDTGLYFSRLAWLPDGSGVVFGKQTRFSLLSMMTRTD